MVDAERPAPMLPDHAPEVDFEGRMMFENVKARLFGSAPEPTRIGEHEVLRRLGAGGMGEVYLAWNPELRRLEAVKVLRTSRGGEPGAQQRLLEEARALARLSHPNVVQVYRGDATAGDVYIAMEYIEGPTLDVWQRQARRTWMEILQVYIAAGHGLAAAHHVGLVHRDFKPSNVLLGKDDGPDKRDPLSKRVRVIDFGLAVPSAVALEDATGPAAAESLSSLVGTPYYVSPEQCDSLLALTPASDQFSFCIALYEALYRQHPFYVPGRALRPSQSPTDRDAIGPTPNSAPTNVAMLLTAICHEPLREPPAGAVPRRLFAILARGLERRPADRHAAMADLVALLERELQPRRRVGLVAVGLTGVLLGGTAVSLTAAGTPGAPELCTDLDGAHVDLWHPERAAAVDQAFQRNKHDAPYATSAFRAIDRGLTAYAAEWSQALATACRDTYQSGKLDEAAYHRRVQCLDARRTALAETVDQLLTDKDTIRRVDTILAALPPVGDCTALQAPRCGDPAALEQVPALRYPLARARADERAGHFETAVVQAAAARAVASSLAEPALLAEAALVHGRLLGELSRWPEAESALLDAYTAADAAGCDELAIDALNRLAKSVALDFDPDRPATDWSPMLFARLDRVYAGGRAGDGLPRSSLEQARRAEVISNRGLLRWRKLPDPTCKDSPRNCPRDLEGASEDFREALRLRESLNPPPLADLSIGHRNLGAVLFHLGRTAEAFDQLERGLAAAADAFGADHPATWRAHFDLGKALAGARRGDEAGPHLERALELVSLGYDPGNLKIGEARLELALHAEDQGDLRRAREHTEAAATIFAALPPTDPRRFNAMRMLGHLYQDTGAYPEALATRSQLLDATARDDLAELATSHVELAQTQNALRRWQDAERHAGHAVDLVDILALDPDDPLRGEALFYRAVARQGLGQPGAPAALRDAETRLRKNLADGVIDSALWVHAAWEATRAACEAVPAELRAALSDPALPPGLHAIREAIVAYDPTHCRKPPRP